MLAEKKQQKNPNQKLIYSKESNYNFSTGENIVNSSWNPSILGIFKTSSALGKSIRFQNEKNPNTQIKLPPIQPKSLSQSTNIEEEEKKSISNNNINNNKSIENQKTNFPNIKAGFKAEADSNNLDIKIRNIIHDYSNIDVNDYTYNILCELRSKKRQANIDLLEDYEIWKTDFWNKRESDIKNKIDKLQNELNKTKDEINDEFEVDNEKLSNYVLNDIDKIKSNFYNTLNNRNSLIEKIHNENNNILNRTLKRVSNKIKELSTQLDNAGFLLEEEIADVCKNKQDYIDKLIEFKKDYYKRVINDIKEDENEIGNKLKEELIQFILRWKNVRLNKYIEELKEILNSKDFIDNNERAELINKLRNDQIEITKKKNRCYF